MMEWRDKENHIAVIAFHKCEIERAHIFELLKPLNQNKGKESECQDKENCIAE